MPRRPNPELDERVKVDLEPDEALRLLLGAKSNESDDSDDEADADQDAE